MENKIEQIANKKIFKIKGIRITSSCEQYIDEKGLTHFVTEVTKKQGKKIIIERKEWIIG